MIEKLCANLFEAQELQESVIRRFEEAEVAAMTVRAQINANFDSLLLAAEGRCMRLRQQLNAISTEHRQGLDDSKLDCSRALGEIWRSIDFLEKTLTRGTDIEVLRVKGQLFRQHQQQILRWQELASRPLPTLAARSGAAKRESARGCTAGWQSEQEAGIFLQRLATFGKLQTTGISQHGKADIPPHKQRMSWADLVSCDSTEDEAEMWFGGLSPIQLSDKKH
nr:B-box C-terminal domain protein [Pfiesteria piscicida]